MLASVLLLALTQDPAAATHLGAWERTLHGLDRPESVAIDPEGRLWVAEAGAGRVRVFSRAGEELARMETGLVEPVKLNIAGETVNVRDRGLDLPRPLTIEGGVELVKERPKK